MKFTEALNEAAVMKPEDVRAVFGNIQQIYEWHKGSVVHPCLQSYVSLFIKFIFAGHKLEEVEQTS